jgi:hypothetical protein
LARFLYRFGDAKFAVIYVLGTALQKYAPFAKQKKTALRNFSKFYLPFILGTDIIVIWKSRALHTAASVSGIFPDLKV